MEDRCQSCGTPWESHPGTQPTCAENQRLKTEVARLKARLEELELERLNRKKYEEDWK